MTAAETRYYFHEPAGQPVWEYKVALGWETFNFYFNGKQVASNSAATTPALMWLHSDHLGSPRIKTDASQVRLSYDTYLPYGEQLNTPSDNIKYRFTGKERDSESGLDYFGARYYGSSIGRFTSADPAKADPSNPQSWNRYIYTLNNPLKYVDPDGRLPITPWELLDLYSYNESRKAWVDAAQGFWDKPSVQTGLLAAGKFLENAYDSLALLTPGLPAVAGLTGRLSDIFKGAKISSEIFVTAIEGGRLSGFLKNYLNRGVDELASGIRSIDNQIALHVKKIEDPARNVKGWDKLTDREKRGLISKWNKDIQRQREQKEILEQLKKIREE